MANNKMDNVHCLAGSNANEIGGLVLKKPHLENESKFKIPKPSILGLDRLAEQRRKEREEAKRLISFKDNEYDDSGTPVHNTDSANNVSEFAFKKPDSQSYQKASGRRQLREHKSETPTHTGGVSDLARERLREHIKRDRSKTGIHYSTSSSTSHKHHRSERNRDYESRRERDRQKRDRNRDRSRERSTPKFRHEPRTPLISVSGSTWDEDDSERPSTSNKKSTWDFPTPKTYNNERDWSERRRRGEDDNTPRATPAHKYNAWANDRKRSGATPATNRSTKQPWGDNDDERDLWEEEQRRLDREWYNIDEGYDDENNPFNGINAEYFKKREEMIEQKRTKRISAQQRQINKDNELWERNRMLTSGVGKLKNN